MFIDNATALLKLQLGTFYIAIVVAVQSNGYNKTTAELYNLWGAGFARFSYSFFNELLRKGYLSKTHTTDVWPSRTYYTPIKHLINTISEATPLSELIDYKELIKR